jgi:ribA/ribD-fused uncharacterized protein
MVTKVKSVAELIESAENGNRHEHLYFWGHKGKKGCLSQWHEDSPFDIDGITYKTAEHWMMASKARLFGDEQSERVIIACNHPRDVKDIGRAVKRFDAKMWDEYKFDFVVQGNIAKFKQNPDILRFLKSTGNKILVEASPYDRVWGIGMHCTDKGIENPKNWKGENLLGFALMEVREQLK